MYARILVTGLILIFLPFLLWLIVVLLGIDISAGGDFIIFLLFIGVLVLIGFILFIAGLFINPKVTVVTSEQASGERERSDTRAHAPQHPALPTIVA